MSIVYGNVKHPPFTDRLIPDHETGAWDDLGTMSVVGVCQHSMVGSLWGTDGWFRRGSNPYAGGSTGLTTYGIGNSTDGPDWDGKIIRWNDPLGASHNVSYTGTNGVPHSGYVSPRRSGWANGGSDGLEGDGVDFVRVFGTAGINRNLVSIERSDGGDTNSPMSSKQFESICQLSAYWFDQAHVPYNEFPLNPKYGIVTHLLHWEFATKSCPHTPVTSHINDIQNRIREILQAAQETAEPKPPKPPTPSHDWPNGWTDADLKQRWHHPVKVSLDGGEVEAKFAPDSDYVNTWVQRGDTEGFTEEKQLPIPERWEQTLGPNDGQVMSTFTFDGAGEHDWVLYRQSQEATWRWIDEEGD